MGSWNDERARDSRLAVAERRVEALEAERDALAAQNERLRALCFPESRECADCGRPVSQALGSPVVLCADCAGPVAPLKASVLDTIGFRFVADAGR